MVGYRNGASSLDVYEGVTHESIEGGGDVSSATVHGQQATVVSDGNQTVLWWYEYGNCNDIRAKGVSKDEVVKVADSVKPVGTVPPGGENLP